jgi:hypothetical protein
MGNRGSESPGQHKFTKIYDNNSELWTLLLFSLLRRHLTWGIGWSENFFFPIPIRRLKPIEMPAEEANFYLPEINKIFDL